MASYLSQLTLQPPSLPGKAPAGKSSTPLGGGRQLTLPWLDYASTSLPDSHSLVLWWAQFLWLSDGNYRTAMERVAAHFLTDLSFTDISQEEQDVWTDVLETHVDYRKVLLQAGHDFLAYANSFSFLYLPFRRSLACGECGFDQPIARVAYEVKFSSTAPYVTWSRTQPCPRCGSMHPMKLRDRRERDMSDIRVIQVPPDEIELAYNRFSDRAEHYWKFSAEDRRDVKSGVKIFIETTPREVLEAVAAGGTLAMSKDVFLHNKENTISGVKTRGWGTPRVISNFRSAWLQQLTNKQDQAIAIDYTLGMRVLSPTQTSGGDDAMVSHAQDNFVARVSTMVNNQRNNPVGYHTSPYPLQYQFLGGEGQGLLPFEKLKFRHQEFLGQLGVPLEYHQMNLSTQAAPMMLKLFENFWQVIPAMYNNMLKWLVGNIARAYNLKPTKVVMAETSLAYDMERKQALLQLMAGQQVSASTALRPFGINATNEAKEVMRYQRMIGKLHAEEEEYQMKQQEMGALRGLAGNPTPGSILEQRMAEQEAQEGGGMGGGMGGMAGGMAGGGMPIGGAGGMGDTSSLHAMSEQSMEIAQQLVQMPSDADRRRELKMLRESNPDLHALVKSNMEKIRGEARSQGGQMLLEGGGPQ